VPDGATTLFNNTLKTETAEKVQEQELAEGQAYLDAPYEALTPLPD
jgi:hypothetical protein